MGAIINALEPNLAIPSLEHLGFEVFFAVANPMRFWQIITPPFK